MLQEIQNSNLIGLLYFKFRSFSYPLFNNDIFFYSFFKILFLLIDAINWPSLNDKMLDDREQSVQTENHLYIFKIIDLTREYCVQ